MMSQYHNEGGSTLGGYTMQGTEVKHDHVGFV